MDGSERPALRAGGSARHPAEKPDRGDPVPGRRRFRVTIRFYTLILCVLLVMLLARLGQGWLAERRLAQEQEALERALEAKRAEILRLQEEVAEMQTDAYVERRAREDLGLVLPGEERYQVIPED